MRASQYMLLFIECIKSSENQASRITDWSRSINNTNVRENKTEIVELW